MQGCAAPPMAPFAGPDPSNASARVPVARYDATIGPVANLRPVEPGPWKTENDPTLPAPEPKP